MAGLFRRFPAAAAAGGFPFKDWLLATTSGQVNYASGITWTGSSGVGRWGYPIEAGRALFVVPNSSGYAVGQVANLAGVGTAQVLLSSALNVDDLVQVPNNPRYFLALLNNDVYLLDCGASGTTLTVTQINSVAGDAGKAEAFVTRVTKIMIDAADHFVIVNEFNDAGTRKWVSALFTLDLGVPSATYVSRDTDATGSAVALEATAVVNSSTLGTGLVIGVNATDSTTARANKVTHTTSTVANSLTNLTTAGMTNVNDTGNYIHSTYPADNLIVFRTRDATSVIEYSGTPQVLAGVNSAFSSGLFNGNPRPAFVDADNNVEANVTGGSGTIIKARFTSVANGVHLSGTRDLLTGLTSSAVCGVTAVDPSGDYIFGAGKLSTNTGQVYVLKRANI